MICVVQFNWMREAQPKRRKSKVINKKIKKNKQNKWN